MQAESSSEALALASLTFAPSVPSLDLSMSEFSHTRIGCPYKCKSRNLQD